MSKIEKLAKRLKEQGVNVDTSTFARVYAGHWQRSSGAWSWWMFLRGEKDTARGTIGSQFSVTALLKANKLQIGKYSGTEMEVDPA